MLPTSHADHECFDPNLLKILTFLYTESFIELIFGLRVHYYIKFES